MPYGRQTRGSTDGGLTTSPKDTRQCDNMLQSDGTYLGYEGGCEGRCERGRIKNENIVLCLRYVACFDVHSLHIIHDIQLIRIRVSKL